MEPLFCALGSVTVRRDFCFQLRNPIFDCVQLM
jgi:hypothetical protein